MDQRRIAVQLYSVRDDCEENLDQSLAKIAGMGYEGVEFAGFYGHPAADVRRMVAEKGLQVVGAHIGMDDLADPAFDRTVEFHKAVGNPTLIVSGLPIEQVTSIPALENAADAFNRTAERLQPLGLRLGYHLHGPDVKPVEGRLPWEVILAGTRENVLMQADIGNALAEGVDIVPYIAKYPGRTQTVHLKEFSSRNPKALIGEGDVDWPRVFETCARSGGTEWYIVEQEQYPAPPMECIQRCLDAIRGMPA